MSRVWGGGPPSRSPTPPEVFAALHEPLFAAARHDLHTLLHRIRQETPADAHPAPPAPDPAPSR